MSSPRTDTDTGPLARMRRAAALPEENQLARFVTLNLLGQGGSLLIGFATSIVWNW